MNTMKERYYRKDILIACDLLNEEDNVGLKWRVIIPFSYYKKGNYAL
jgi:hypothetical protein